MGHADHRPDWELLMVTAEGRRRFGEMAAWKGKLSERQIAAKIAYICGQMIGGASKTGSPDQWAPTAAAVTLDSTLASFG